MMMEDAVGMDRAESVAVANHLDAVAQQQVVVDLSTVQAATKGSPSGEQTVEAPLSSSLPRPESSKEDEEVGSASPLVDFGSPSVAEESPRGKSATVLPTQPAPPSVDAVPDLMQSGVLRKVRGSRASFLPGYKVVVVGDAAVGKSNLLSRFTSNTFDVDTRSTIGAEFVTREVDLSLGAQTLHGNFTSPAASANGSPPQAEESFATSTMSIDRPTADRAVLQLWDTAGQDTTATLASVYFRGARGVAVVYDVTRKQSLLSVGRWIAKAREVCDADSVIVVIGNKSDLVHSIEVTPDEADAFCHSLGVRHFKASAMNGEGVAFAFLQLLLSIHAEANVRGVANPLPNSVALARQASSGDGGGGGTGATTSVGGAGVIGFSVRDAKRRGGSDGGSKKKERLKACCRTA